MDTALKIDYKGLKFQNWFYLMVFSVVILAVLWALQFLFLGSFYESMKLSEIKSIGNRITERFGEPAFHAVLDEYAFSNNLRIILMDELGWTWTFDGFPSDSLGTSQRGSFGRFALSYLSPALSRLQESALDTTHYIDENALLGTRQSVYITKVSDNSGSSYFLYISSPIPSIDSTTSVLRTQFYIITAILLVLALVMAQWISRKMSKPIIRLTKSAERLVRGDLEEAFYDDSYTEIHQLASALNYATGELRNLDNYRREFIANVSHDLRTPLTIIKFYGELIKDVSGSDPQKRTEHCETIIKETDWLTGMVGEILELSKLESSNADVSMAELNLSQSLKEVLASFSALAEKSGYSFETSIEDNLAVYGNEPMLRRVLYNLISNAVNFTGDDMRVIVSLKHVNGYVCFDVTDTGEGIEQDKQGIIWDRYYKSKETHKRAVIGTGLGLSIVKSALTLHGAEFGVISESGKGSTFWFYMRNTILSDNVQGQLTGLSSRHVIM